MKTHNIDTSTSGDDSGIFSLGSTSPGQSPTPERFSPLEWTPVPEPDCILAPEVPCQPSGLGTTAQVHPAGPEEAPRSEQTTSMPSPGQMPSPESLWQMVVSACPDLCSNSPIGSSCQTGGPEEAPQPEKTKQVTGPGQMLSPESLQQKVIDACPDISCDSLFISSCQVSLKATGDPTIHFSTRSWSLNYPVLSFLMNGQLYAEYARVTGTLGSYSSFHGLFTSL